MKINFGTNNYSEYTPGNKSLNLNQISNKNKQVRKSYE